MNDLTRAAHNSSSAGVTRIVVALFAAALLVLSLIFAGTTLSARVASADIYSADSSSAQTLEQDSDASAGADSAKLSTAQNADSAAGGEVIEDEENPMASGMYKDSSVNSSPVLWIVIIGILAVAGFFGFAMYRLNSNIKKMRDKFH